MAKQLFANEQAMFSVRFRAVCQDDNFKGPWQANHDDARTDAINHRQVPGNEDHVIRIITQQTLDMLFVE